MSLTVDSVAEALYIVLDFDGFDGFGGVKPVTPAEKEAHLRDSFAMIRWPREEMEWVLKAILHTGSKNLHAWFLKQEPEALESLKAVAAELGIDASLIGRPEHPYRLPGQGHAETAELSAVCWLECRRQESGRDPKKSADPVGSGMRRSSIY